MIIYRCVNYVRWYFGMYNDCFKFLFDLKWKKIIKKFLRVVNEGLYGFVLVLYINICIVEFVLVI